MTTKTFEPKISKEDLNKLEAETYKGSIFVVNTVEEAEDAISYLKSQSIVGFDTETKPSFVKGERHTVSLLQLGDSKVTYLFRLNKIGITESLLKFFNCRSVLKIGLSTKDDFRALRELKKGIRFSKFIELQNYVTQYGIEEKSLTKIYALIFNKRISKSQRLTNWEAENLTDKQKQYAALDSYATRRIFAHLEGIKKQTSHTTEAEDISADTEINEDISPK